MRAIKRRGHTLPRHALAWVLALLVHAVTLGLAVAGVAVIAIRPGTFSGWALGWCSTSASVSGKY